MAVAGGVKGVELTVGVAVCVAVCVGVAVEVEVGVGVCGRGRRGGRERLLRRGLRGLRGRRGGGRRVLRDGHAAEHRGVQAGAAQGNGEDLLWRQAHRAQFTRAWAASGRQRLSTTSASRGPRLSKRAGLAASMGKSNRQVQSELHPRRHSVTPSHHARGTLPTRRAGRGADRGRGRHVAHLDAHPLRSPAGRLALDRAGGGRRDRRLPDRHRGGRAQPAVLRAGLGDHHAGDHRRPARAPRLRARDRRCGRASGSPTRSCC